MSLQHLKYLSNYNAPVESPPTEFVESCKHSLYSCCAAVILPVYYLHDEENKSLAKMRGTAAYVASLVTTGYCETDQSEIGRCRQ